MNTFTIADIRSWEPCYDPAKHLPEDWQGTVLDLLEIKEIPFQDALWVLMRNEFVSDKFMRLFAVWCARQVVDDNTHPDSVNAIDVAEAYANNYELVDCKDYQEAWDLELSAARNAAYSAADYAARNAAYSAADSAAGYSTYCASRSAQKEQLRKMLNEGDGGCEMTDLEIIAKGLAKFFKDEPEKITYWLVTENPMFGGVTPSHLIYVGRAKVVARFVENAANGEFL